VRPAAVTPYSQLRWTDRRPLADRLPLSGPLSLYIETHNTCNFKCVQCPVSFDDYYEIVGGQSRISDARYEKLLDELAAMGTLKSLKFYVEGEPFLDKRLPRMIKQAVDAQVCERTEVTSNGSALTPQNVRATVLSGLTYLRISIYALTEERQKSITQSGVSLARIYENIKMARRVRDELGSPTPFLYVKMIDTFSAEDEQEFRRRFEGIADEIFIEPPMNWDGFDGRDLINNLYTDKHFAQSASIKAVCPFPFYSLVIKANGDVVACCVDWNKHTRVGNINDSAFADIWFGEPLREFKRMHLERRKSENPSCRSCTFIDTTPDNLDGIVPEHFEHILGPRPSNSSRAPV